MELRLMTDKNNLQNLQKPYWDEELELIVAQDDEANIHAQKSLHHFFQTHQVVKSNYNHNNIFMTINNLFHKFTLATISVGIITILAISTVTAQALAPEEYKPSNIVSNLFSANKQPDKDPTTQLAPNSVLAKTDPSLSPDDNNYVVNLEGCDLAVKVPKKVGDVEVNVSIMKFDTSSILSREYDYEYDNGVGGTSTMPRPEFEIKCINLQKEEEDLAKRYSKEYLEEWRAGVAEEQSERIKASTLLTKEALQQETGWFVSTADIKDIYKKIENDGIAENGRVNGTNLAKTTYFFKYNGNDYDVTFYKMKNSFAAQDIQLQFNSLVKNKFSENPDFYVKTCDDTFTAQYDNTKYDFGSRQIYGWSNGLDNSSGSGDQFEIGLKTYFGPDPNDTASVAVACYDIKSKDLPVKGKEALSQVLTSVSQFGAWRTISTHSENSFKKTTIDTLPKTISDQVKKDIDPENIYQYTGMVDGYGDQKSEKVRGQVFVFIGKNNQVFSITYFNLDYLSKPGNEILIDYKK